MTNALLAKNGLLWPRMAVECQKHFRPFTFHNKTRVYVGTALAAIIVVEKPRRKRAAHQKHSTQTGTAVSRCADKSLDCYTSKFTNERAALASLCDSERVKGRTRLKINTSY